MSHNFQLNAAARLIDEAGRAHFSDSYAGVEVDEGRGVAVVYRVPSAGFDEAAQRIAGAVPVELRPAPRAVAELTGLHGRIVADLDFWRRRGIEIHTVGVRHDGTGVEVGTGDVATARRELAGHYGDQAPIIVVPQDPVVPLTMPGPARS